MGCHYAQGFFFGHPLTRTEVEEMLAKVYKQFKTKE
jgi:EAL domain-containing protein (putative c-di-GMP-specific phosphodiesterase class I)